jgi:hypothetical protein
MVNLCVVTDSGAALYHNRSAAFRSTSATAGRMKALDRV